jgi:hypothetical protein
MSESWGGGRRMKSLWTRQPLRRRCLLLCIFIKPGSHVSRTDTNIYRLRTVCVCETVYVCVIQDTNIYKHIAETVCVCDPSISYLFNGELAHLQFPCSLLSVRTSRVMGTSVSGSCHFPKSATFWWRPALLRLLPLPSIISMIHILEYSIKEVEYYIQKTFYP